MISAGDASLYICLALALLAAVLDVRSRKIPNLLNAAIGISAIVFAYLSGGWEGLGLNALHALVALLVGMALFAMRFFGAGDAKMYSAAAFAVSPGEALMMLGWTSVSGLVLLIAMALTRRALKQPLRKDGKTFTVPYGVAIAAGLWIVSLT